MTPPFLRLERLRRPYFPLGWGYLAAAWRQAGHEESICHIAKAWNPGCSVVLGGIHWRMFVPRGRRGSGRPAVLKEVS